MSIIDLVYQSLTQRTCSVLFGEGIDIIRDVIGNSFEIVMDDGTTFTITAAQHCVEPTGATSAVPKSE